MRGVFVFKKRIIEIGLAIAVGIAMGLTIGFLANRTPIQTVKELNEGVATLLINDVKNGIINGKIVGQKTRIAHGRDAIQTLGEGESFSIPIKEISLGSYFISEKIPKEALWVASKSGKNAYLIFDKQAYRIKEENRVYFSSDTEAKKAGYKIVEP